MKNLIAKRIINIEFRKLDAIGYEYGCDNLRYEQDKAKKSTVVRMLEDGIESIRTRIFSWAVDIQDQSNWEQFEASTPIRITHNYLRRLEKDPYYIKTEGKTSIDNVRLVAQYLKFHPYFQASQPEDCVLPDEVGHILNEYFGLAPIPQNPLEYDDCYYDLDLYELQAPDLKNWISKWKIDQIIRSYSCRDPYIQIEGKLHEA